MTAPNHDAASRSAIPTGVPAEDAEMWCERCGNRHGLVWFTPSDIWNITMREGDRGNPDRYSFCCPSCFMALADEALGGQAIWRIELDDGRAIPPVPRVTALLSAHRTEYIGGCQQYEGLTEDQARASLDDFEREAVDAA